MHRGSRITSFLQRLLRMLLQALQAVSIGTFALVRKHVFGARNATCRRFSASVAHDVADVDVCVGAAFQPCCAIFASI
jgi:hypothetical protein